MAQVKTFDGGQLAGIVEGFTTLEWTRPYYTPGRFSLAIPRAAFDAATLTRGRTLTPPDTGGVAYLIEQIEKTRGGGGVATTTVSGRAFGGLLAERDCVPPAGQMHDTRAGVAPETAMKGYVTAHAGPGAPAVARLPGLAVAADLARPAGITATYQARYQYVADLLAEIGQPVGIGWQVTLDETSGELVFDVIVGRDRAAEGIVFDVAFDTATAADWLASDLDRKTVVRVLGQGEGAARTVVVVWLGMDQGAPEPAGFDRRVLVLDARDLTTIEGLRQRGFAKLAEMAATDRFEVAVNQHGSFRYRRDWDLGDLVAIRDEGWEIDRVVRVVGVTARITPERGDTPAITVALDRPMPTIKERLAGAAIGNGSARE